MRGLLGLALLVLRCGAAPYYSFLAAEPVGRAGGRELSTCNRHDATDSSVQQCQDWCRYPEHCAFCKCRACSMCKPCHSNEPEDLAYEGCEEWCSVPEHCSACKCKVCAVCVPSR